MVACGGFPCTALSMSRTLTKRYPEVHAAPDCATGAEVLRAEPLRTKSKLADARPLEWRPGRAHIPRSPGQDRRILRGGTADTQRRHQILLARVSPP